MLNTLRIEPTHDLTEARRAALARCYQLLLKLAVAAEGCGIKNADLCAGSETDRQVMNGMADPRSGTIIPDKLPAEEGNLDNN